MFLSRNKHHPPVQRCLVSLSSGKSLIFLSTLFKSDILLYFRHFTKLFMCNIICRSYRACTKATPQFSCARNIFTTSAFNDDSDKRKKNDEKEKKEELEKKLKNLLISMKKVCYINVFYDRYGDKYNSSIYKNRKRKEQIARPKRDFLGSPTHLGTLSQRLKTKKRITPLQTAD